MDSESARMSSAAEARYRIDYPNSKPRVIKVVALDAASEHVVKRVAERQWQRATFFTSIKFDGPPTRADEPGSGRASGMRTMELPRWPLASAAGGEGWSMQAWLSDLAGRTKALVDEVASADLVVMVSSAGTSAQARRCHRRGLRRAQGDDHGADHRQRGALQRRPVEDPRDVAALCLDARHRQRRRIHRGDAVGTAGVSSARRIIIVGGGPAGVAAALAAKQQDAAAEVVLLNDEHHEPYEKPPLSKAVLTGKAAAPGHADRRPEGRRRNRRFAQARHAGGGDRSRRARGGDRGGRAHRL